ncbi:DUF58 domain-containing protein [Nitriliruptoraceae bacterium ZYF776]|nr:DUF58 domain-containing protein [Profundirhabdus halotolerans]
MGERPGRATPSWARGAQVAERVRLLELVTARLSRGVTYGSYASASYGSGGDRGEAAEYHPGDDVRHIDWAASARTATLTVRLTHAEREARVAVVVDGAPSMAFGTEALTKHEMAVCVAAAVTRAASVGGNPVLLAHATTDGPRWEDVPPGRTTALPVLQRLAGQHPRLDHPGASTLATTLGQLGRRFARVDLVVVVSDLHAEGWQRPLRGLAQERPVVVVAPYDRRERDLVAVGDLALAGGDHLVDLATDDPAVLVRWREEAAGLAAEREAAARGAGARYVEVACDAEVEDDVLAVLRQVTRVRA